MLEKQGNDVRLGDYFRDAVTEIEGTATAQCRYLTGNDTVRLEWLKDGETHDEWIDINRLEWLRTASVPELAEAKAK